MALTVEQLYEVMAQLPDPVFILSELGDYVEYIGGIEQQSYQDGNPLVGKMVADILPEDKAAWMMAQIRAALDSGQVQVVEYELSPSEVKGIDTETGPQGVQYFEGKIAPLPSLYEGRRAVAWVIRNITSQRELQQRLKQLSETDQLTGLHNRHFFFEHYPKQVAVHPQTGLIMLDIDHFKQINDLYGHQVGDRVLQCFSRCVKALLRSEDLFVRSGGEEFVILLPGLAGVALRRVAERIRLAVETMLVDPSLPELRVTVSLGSTDVLPQEEVSTVLARADEWLYRAKRAGRNRVEHCVMR